MPKLHVYRIVTDNNTAPHVSQGVLTLTLCKPNIRAHAKVGDYVLSLVALTNKQWGKASNPNRYYYAAYLFEITEIVDIKAYEAYCEEKGYRHRICRANYFEGNCQYNAAGTWRPGPHGPAEQEKNLKGKYSLVSTHFAAWTSVTPFLLDSATRTSLGLNDVNSALKVGPRGHVTVSLDAARSAALNALIDANQPAPAPAPAPALAPAAAEGANVGGTRKRNRRGRRKTRRA
jgi:hypothetical protein